MAGKKPEAKEEQQAQPQAQPKMINTSAPMPWWGKVILGVAGVYLISTKTPILEILNLFFYIVMIPIGLMVSIGLISTGSLQVFSQNWGNMMNDVKSKIETRAQEIVSDSENKKAA